MLKKYQATLLVTGLLILIILPRLFNLGAFMTADEKQWLGNTAGFTKGLATLNWEKLVQQPHPGITNQWLGAITVHSDSWEIRKLPLVIGQSILLLLVLYVFWQLWGKWPAVLLTTLLAINLLLIAHTRVYAMDSLLAVFCLLAVGLLLLWNKTHEPRYLYFSAFATAAAILSKLPGVILIPFTALFLATHAYHTKKYKLASRLATIWLLVFFISLALILPSFFTHPTTTFNRIAACITQGGCEPDRGTAPPTYYLRTLIFFSTPLHMLAIVALPFFFWKSKKRHDAAWLAFFAVVFVIEMTLSAKKGDRYILPAFLIFDALTVTTFFWLYPVARLKSGLYGAAVTLVLVAGLLWQTATLIRLHPHYLAYVNPITKPFFGVRRLGWGEGFDIAGAYLNTKPDSQSLKVAAPYPTEFAYNFSGEVVSINRHENDSINYVVLYRAMLEREPDSVETDIVNFYKNKTPEKIISLGGLPYIWIYHTSPSP